MKKAIVIILLLAVIISVAYKIATYQKAQIAQSIQDIQRTQGVPVEVLTLRPDTLSYSREFSGTIEGFYQTSAVAHLMEAVKEVRVKVGEPVTEKDVLVVLEQSSPQAQFQQAKLARDNALQEFERAKALFEQGAVSRQMYDQAALAKDIAETNYSNAKELVEIPAPISGVVTDVIVKPGQLVTPGQPVVTISTTDRIKSEFWVGDADRQQMKMGQIAEFIPSDNHSETGLSNGKIIGSVSEIALSADQQSHLYKVTVTTNNTGGRLRPGQLVSINVITETVPNVILVPSEALILKNDKPFVYKVESNIARLIPISLGRENRNQVEVVNGLSLGDTIVVYGGNRLKSGDKINIVSSIGEAENVPK